MTSIARLAVAPILALGMSACGEAPLKAPLPGRNLDGGKLDGGPAALAFPTSAWSDDYGSGWQATVTGERVTAEGVCGAASGLVLAGVVAGQRLDYRISGPAGDAIASGHADLINADHAFFETRLLDGSLNAEGVLHFSHASHVREAALPPAGPCIFPLTPLEPAAPELDGGVAPQPLNLDLNPRGA